MLNRIRAAVAQLLAPTFAAQDTCQCPPGDVFDFYPVSFSVGCTGILDDAPGHPVVVMLDEHGGIAMSRESAQALISELQAVLSSPHLPTAVEPSTHER